VHRLTFAVATSIVLGITACSSDESTSTPNTTPIPADSNVSLPRDPPVSSTRTVDGLLTVTPAEVAAGGTVEATFSGDLANDRGGYFYLNNSTGNPVAVLWTDKDEERGGAGSSTQINETVILDYAIVDPDPDTLILPTEVQPGRYQLCTANSIPRTCTEIEIVTS